MSVNERLQAIGESFERHFGRTPLPERLQDIHKQAICLERYTDFRHLREEAGDLLCSLLQLCNENCWSPDELINATLAKIESRQDTEIKLGRKLRVALYAGSFDPIHQGHIRLVTEVVKSGVVDQVWLMPCFVHSLGKTMAPAEDRVQMCRLASASLRGVKVFDYEIHNRFRGETYHLVKMLLDEEYARREYDFMWLVDQETADKIHTLSNGHQLERMLPMVVVPRSGVEPPRYGAWYLQPPHCYLYQLVDLATIRSDEVRQRLEQGDAAVSELIDPAVLRHIHMQGLYQSAKTRVEPVSRSRTLVMYATTFDPPGIHHRRVAETLLAQGLNEVIVRPTGRRDDRQLASSMHRAAMVDLAFNDLPGVRVDLTDLESGRFTPSVELEQLYGRDTEVWHVARAEHIAGGGAGNAEIQRVWSRGGELWQRGRFVVLHCPGNPPASADLPPQHRLLSVDRGPSSEDLHRLMFDDENVDDILAPHIRDYARRHNVFLPAGSARANPFRLSQTPRLMLVFDERNPKAVALAEKYRCYEHSRPDMILAIGGDGTILNAIRRHWRLRLPIVGLNAGHLGFLANEKLPPLENAALVTYALPMLRVMGENWQRQPVSGMAFSDVWIEREGGQAAWLRLDIDGQPRISKIAGDGVLVSTAAGSSAYARAIGATPVPLTTPVLTLAGSNVFRPQFWKPMTLSDSARITLTTLDESEKRPVRGFIDGSPLNRVRCLTIDRSPIATVELAFTAEFDPNVKLLSSLFPPGDEVR